MKSSSKFAQKILKTTKIVTLGAVFALFFSLHVPQALAMVPSLSVSSSGVNQIMITVNGDQNQTVNLYYYPLGTSGSIISVGSIGSTNSSGYFSNTINSTSYNVPAGANVYVVVNGQQSSNAVWPSVSGGNIYLSQSSISMNQGQTAQVSISGGQGNNYYVASNSNSNVVTISISGNIINLNAINTGYTVVSICSLGTYTGCTSLNVTVNNSWGGSSTNLSLSQNSVSVAPGQTQSVYIYENAYGYNNGYYNNGYYNSNYYGQNQYYISNNPGTQYFSASISGNVVTVYGTNPGSATINICSLNSGSNCVSLYVTVSGSYYNGNYYNNYNGYNGYTGYYGNNGYYYYSSGYPYNNYTYPTTTYTYPVTTYSSGSTYGSGSAYGSSVSGVFLSQLPNTGISFGFKMTLFAIGLALWSIFAAYMIARRKTFDVVAAGALKSKAGNGTSTIADKINAFKMQNLKNKGL